MTDTESDLQSEAKKRKRGSGTTAEALKKSASYYDEGGDLEIISSDDVLFKVHAYFLQAGSLSSVFRALIADSSPSRIELTDQEIEHKENLEAFFDLLIKGTFDLDGGCRHLTSLIRLAKKYDFELALERIALRTRSTLVTNAHRNVEAFAVGVALDDQELCATALRTEGGLWRQLNDNEKPKFGSFLHQGRLEDPASLDLESFRSFSHEILWAWSRAYRVTFGPHEGCWEGDEEDLEAMSDEFVRLMKLEGAPKTLS